MKYKQLPNGHWTVHNPDLPGFGAWGLTKEEAENNIVPSLIQYIKGLQKLLLIKHEWNSFPDTAPKDREILISGIWKPVMLDEENIDIEGGEREYQIATYTTIMSDGTGYHWMIGLTSLDQWNVEWDLWMEIPKAR